MTSEMPRVITAAVDGADCVPTVQMKAPASWGGHQSDICVKCATRFVCSPEESLFIPFSVDGLGISQICKFRFLFD